MTVRIVPVELAEANTFVGKHHRHRKPVIGHRFSLGCVKDGALVGVAIVGRPVARLTDQRAVAEVTRLCTDGTRNACSALYSAAARVCREAGFERIQTFILDSETGSSLKASGWTFDGESAGGDGWQSREGRRDDQPTNPKGRWVRELNPPTCDQWRDGIARLVDPTPTLFDTEVTP